MAQIKIIAAEDTIEKFKRIVLAKHGKLELSAEGEEALRLYIRKYEKVHNPVLRLVIRVEDMAQKILTLRLKTQDERNINDLLKIGRYRSKTEIIREALLLLREKEAVTTLRHVSRRTRKHPKLDIDTISKRLANSWITSKESGDLIDADRER